MPTRRRCATNRAAASTASSTGTRRRSKKLSLSRTNAAGLVAALSSDNMLWRLHAQRLLIERGQKDVVPQLIALTRNKSVDELGLNGAALHALWTLHGTGRARQPEQ